jgi:hypothetical protein
MTPVSTFRRTTRPIAGAASAVVLLMALAAACGAAAKDPFYAPAVAPLTVDGDAADWTGVPTVYLEQGPRVTALAHDDNFLYVHFRFSDLELARRVLREGAIVWVDVAGKRKEGYGLRYRGSEAARAAMREMEGGTNETRPGPPPGEPPQGRPSGEGGPPEGPRRAPPGGLEVLRAGVTDDVIADASRDDGPAAACVEFEGSFSFELRIPIAEAAPAGAEGAAGVGMPLSVGFQMGGLTAAERKGRRETAGSGPPPGGGGGREGGSGQGGGPPGAFGGQGGGPGGPPGGGQGRGGPGGGGRMSEVKTVWLDVALAPRESEGSAP